MKPREKGQIYRAPVSQDQMQTAPRDGLHWTVIIGGVIVSTLSISAVRVLRRAFQLNGQKTTNNSNQNEENPRSKQVAGVHSLPPSYYRQDGIACTHCILDASFGTVEMKLGPQDSICQFGNLRRNTSLVAPHCKLSELQIHSENQEDSPIWSPEQLELPNCNLMLSNSSESICTSESGSDHYSKRDVVLRLRNQLKKRDEMILEMQSQINDQLKIIGNQIAHITNVQSQLDSTNSELFESEREIQRLRKAIADHCVGHTMDVTRSYALVDQSSRSIVNLHTPKFEQSDQCDGQPSKIQEQMLRDCNSSNSPEVNNWKVVEKSFRKGAAQNLSLDMVKDLEKEILELKESLDGKNYLLEIYEKQRLELCSQLKDLQVKLADQMSTML